MDKYKKIQRILSITMLLLFMNSIIMPSALLASNNGPNAPEAAAFEPIDATDMVNLVTGDFTYVLPLLNVPSPEGGYPLSLSYHAGIAVDQEASWVGLGWNVNPGAINRSINGYPDDWNGAESREYFYDEGESDSGWSATLTYHKGGSSIGLGVSQSTSRGFGGHVSFSTPVYDVRFGTDGVDFNANLGIFSVGTSGIKLHYSASFTIPGTGIRLHGSIGSSGYSIGVGYGKNAQLGLGFSSDWSGNSSVSLNADVKTGVSSTGRNTYSGIGISFSSNGFSVNAKINNVGIGVESFEHNIKGGDYNVWQNHSKFFIPIPIPGVGLFFLSYSQYSVGYNLNLEKRYQVRGTLYASQIPTSTPSDFEDRVMDSFEFDSRGLREDDASFALPAYDQYRVSAQGLSGNLQPNYFENIAIKVNNIEKENEDEIRYYTDRTHTSYRPVFHFQNEYSSNLEVSSGRFQPTSSSSINNFKIIDSKLSSEIDLNDPFIRELYSGKEWINTNKKQMKHPRLVEYFTNDEILNSSISLFIEASEFNRKGIANFYKEYEEKISYEEKRIPRYPYKTCTLDKETDQIINRKYLNDIGAYRITTPDGKTYHYSLPVYHFEEVQRTVGSLYPGKETKTEDQAHVEKRQLQPYVTDWLLTAVTGPDYVDRNGNRQVDQGDFGYWVQFDYGKWSDGYVWRNPATGYHTKGDVKSYSFGRKQKYYLNKIVTRTHTALFLKKVRKDDLGASFQYKGRGSSVTYKEAGVGICLSLGRATRGNLVDNFQYKQEKSLALDQIYILKNKDLQGFSLDQKIRSSLISKETNSIELQTGISRPKGPLEPNTKRAIRTYNKINYSLHQGDNILETSDFSTGDLKQLDQKTIEKIEFVYGYNLFKGSPNSNTSSKGKLSLIGLVKKGKAAKALIPPYKFEYERGSSYPSDLTTGIDAWGYLARKATAGSLNKIKLPTGGTLSIDYEQDEFRLLNTLKNGTPSSYLLEVVSSKNKEPRQKIEARVNFGSIANIRRGDKVNIDYSNTFPADADCDYEDRYGYKCHRQNSYHGLGTIKKINRDKTAEVYADGRVQTSILYNYTGRSGSSFGISISVANKGGTPNQLIRKSGLRVKAIEASDGTNSFKTEYRYYGGVATYDPAMISENKVPLISELPAPIPMYERVQVEQRSSKNRNNGYTEYQFKVFKHYYDQSIHSLKTLNIENQQSLHSSGKGISTRHANIEDRTSCIGQLLSMTHYNKDEKILSKTRNIYETADTGQGVVKESFHVYKELERGSGANHWYLNTISKTQYPSVLKATEVTQGNYTSRTEFNGHDPYTGQALVTRTANSKGANLTTKSLPAYLKYPSMGHKLDNSGKHMLTQPFGSYVYYKASESAPQKLLSAGVTTWNDRWTYKDYNGNSITDHPGIWRKKSSYAWQSMRDESGFISSSPVSLSRLDPNALPTDPIASQATGWQKTSETTLYDQFSAPLEAKDINGNFASSKMDFKHEKTIVSGNSAYDRMYYSGAEEAPQSGYAGGQMRLGVTTRSSNAHTGSYSLSVGAGQRGYIAKLPAGTYRASLWVNKRAEQQARLNVSRAIVEETVKAGNWVQLNFEFTLGVTTDVYTQSTSGTVLMDDFRVHPIESSVNSYVYDQNTDELTFTLSANNLATKYEYDAVGRLVKMYEEIPDRDDNAGGFKLASQYAYNYKLNFDSDPNDQAATYEPMSVHLSLDDHEAYSTTVTAIVSGGSGNFRIQSTASSVPNPTNFGNSGRVLYINVPCRPGRIYYAFRITDKETDITKIRQGSHARDCNDGDGPGDPIK